MYATTCYFALLAVVVSVVSTTPVSHHASQVSPNRYIVKMKSSVSLSSTDPVLSQYVEKADHVYTHVLNGFSAELDSEELATLRLNAAVCLVLDLPRAIHC